MHAIIRQTKANLKSHKLQAALILLTLCAATALLTLALSTLNTAQGAYDRLFQRTRGAHLWLDLDAERVSEDEAARILAGLPGVEATTAVMRQTTGILFWGEERLGNQRFREWPQETGVSRLLLVGGRAPEPGETDAITLNRNVAATHGIKIGDKVDLLTPDGRRTLTIVGLVLSAETCPYPSCQPPQEYLAPGAMTALGLLPPPLPDQESMAVGLRLRDPAGSKAAFKAAEERLPAQSIINWESWKETRLFADIYVRVPRVFLMAFGIVAGLAAGFLIVNAIGGAVRAQARQIGLLKAVGFTRRQLALVYLLEYLGLALVASLVGLGLGSLASSIVLEDITALFAETLHRPPSWIALFTPLSALLIAALSALWPVFRAVRLDAVETIRVGAERPRRRMARLPRVRLPLAVGLSDVLSRPLRSTLTALGLGMTVLALTAVLSLGTTLQTLLTNDTLWRGADGDIFLYPSRYLPEAELRRLVAGQADVSAHLTTAWQEFRFEGEEETLHARFREGDLEDFEFLVLEGRMFESADEGIVGYGLAQERNLHPGDTATILLEGEPLTFQVVGIYREGSNMGRMLGLPTEALRRVQPDVRPFEHVLKLRPGADAQAVAEALDAAFEDLLEIDVAGEGLDASVEGLFALLPGMLAALSLILGGIAVLGIFNSVWMGVQERRREFGMLKAVGMTPGQVTLSVLVGAAGLALVGYVVGLPVGLVGVRLIVDTLARGVGFGPLGTSVDGVGLALLLPGIVLVALAGAFVPAHRAGRTSVVETLRYE
ncbi:MAG: FtsX-like permease family protein [Anaerolineae bacterium]|jgi:putative ABC transport system permease protein